MMGEEAGEISNGSTTTKWEATFSQKRRDDVYGPAIQNGAKTLGADGAITNGSILR